MLQPVTAFCLGGGGVFFRTRCIIQLLVYLKLILRNCFWKPRKGVRRASTRGPTVLSFDVSFLENAREWRPSYPGNNREYPHKPYIARNCTHSATFLQGVNMACYAEPCISYGPDVGPDVCLYVCLSVRRWHWVKTTQGRITKSSPTDSPRTCFRDKKFIQKFERVHTKWGR